eukprot:8971934-Lingulodinium_polyedra.AAC.1
MAKTAKWQRPPTPPVPRAFLEGAGGATRAPTPASSVGSGGGGAPEGSLRRESRTPPPKAL